MAEVHPSNSGKPSMTDQASQKPPSVIDDYKCKFVMTKEERIRQCFMHNHGKCKRFHDFEVSLHFLFSICTVFCWFESFLTILFVRLCFQPKCIPDKLLFHPSQKRRTSWEHSKILRVRTSSSLPDPCFSSSLTFHYDMMAREEPESPTH